MPDSSHPGTDGGYRAESPWRLFDRNTVDHASPETPRSNLPSEIENPNSFCNATAMNEAEFKDGYADARLLNFWKEAKTKEETTAEKQLLDLIDALHNTVYCRLDQYTVEEHTDQPDGWGGSRLIFGIKNTTNGRSEKNSNKFSIGLNPKGITINVPENILEGRGRKQINPEDASEYIKNNADALTTWLKSRNRAGPNGLFPCAYANAAPTHPTENHNQNPCSMPLNTILYGPPGTGKTFSVTTLALNVLAPEKQGVAKVADSLRNGQKQPVIDANEWRTWNEKFQELCKAGRLEIVTFHQNYAYEDFIEGLKASISPQNPGQVTYKVEDGIFKRMAYRAMYAWITGTTGSPEITNDERATVDNWLISGAFPAQRRESNTPAPPYVLVIDEINRGNISRILGELITLIEPSKRAKLQEETALGDQPLSATLPYTKKPFMVPPNLYIIGTMNTADRSLIGLDAALRRRFDFVEMPPRPDLLGTCESINLDDLLKQLNQRIAEKYDRDHAIGHAFLMGVTDVKALAQAMRNKILPLLQEYFHDRPEDLRYVLAQRFLDTDLRLVETELKNTQAYCALYPQQ